jgi:hypothetical protein
VVRIDVAEDAEAAADALRLRPEVDHARRRIASTMFRPNDPCTRRAVEPALINMERA